MMQFSLWLAYRVLTKPSTAKHFLGYGSGMKNLLLCLLVAGCWTSAGAMVNGSSVLDAEFTADYPWMVVVVHQVNGGICGGVLISPTWVLTAAHCTASQKFVLYGSADRSKANRVEVIRAIRHPKYNKPSGQNDVGLLQLAEPLPLAALHIANPADELAWLKSDLPATLLGWGRLPDRTLPDRLQQFSIADSQRRAGGSLLVVEAAGGPCHRDSGGPLVIADESGNLKLLAVISATEGNLCSKGGGTSYYTLVSSAGPFIAQQVKDLP
jgi:secreted trypsin-like serine protease